MSDVGHVTWVVRTHGEASAGKPLALAENKGNHTNNVPTQPARQGEGQQLPRPDNSITRRNRAQRPGPEVRGNRAQGPHLKHEKPPDRYLSVPEVGLEPASRPATTGLPRNPAGTGPVRPMY